MKVSEETGTRRTVLRVSQVLMLGSVGSLCREVPAVLPGEGDVDGVFWAPGPAGWTGCL